MGVCDIPLVSTVCDTAGEAAASLVSAPFDWLAGAMGAAAGWLFEAVWAVFDTTTLVDVTSPEYVSVYNILFGIAVFVMLIFFCLQLITGLIRRDPTALSRAALGLAKSVLGSFVVITLTALLLEIVDQLCIGIIQAAGETTESMGDKIALLAAGLVGINIAAPGVGAIITIFLAGLAIAAAAIVWLSLLVRKALLLVASVADPIAGIVLMAMAAFAPYLTYKFIAFVGFDMYHAIGSEQDAKNALNSPVPVPSKPGGNGGGEPKKVLDDNDGGGGGGGKKPPEPKNPTPASSSGTAGAGSKAAASSSAGAGAGGGAGAGAAAGPAAAAVVAAKVAKDAATAGPKAGEAIGNQADSTADSAGQTGTTPPPAQAPPPSTPAPKTPGAGPTAGPSQPEARPPKQPPPPAPKPTGKE
ncbi:hypothetical protein [Gordonia iterans]